MIDGDILYDVDPDVHYFGSDLQQSNYYSVDQYKDLCYDSKSFISIINYNIRSFSANSDSMISMFSSSSFPEILTLTETWFNEDNLEDISGYSSFHITRKLRRSGGISIFVKQDISAIQIPHLSFSNETIEVCTVEAKFADCSITFIGIYRSYSDTVNNFIELLNSVISYPYLAGRNCKILEDLNMNIADDTGPS